LASLIGTTIEFFDFYIYATAAVLVFPHLFFPDSSEQAALLQSLATFAVAFIARPVGSAVFGHFGDRIGRKATLVAALLTMGLSTVLIGLLPTYAQIGTWRRRCWRCAASARAWAWAASGAGRCCWPPRTRRRASAPGTACSRSWARRSASSCRRASSCCWPLLSQDDFLSWGWRIPFVASALLVGLGLYIR
jgi:MFS family permease